MRDDLVVGNEFPDISLPEHTGKELSLSQIARQQPLVLAFVRGWWCPKEQIRLKKLVDAQDELQREYGRIAVATVDEPYVNGAFRAGIGADFPFLSDEERRIADELDLLELTDELHRPFLPYTFVLDSNRIIRNLWCGFWYWGNPTIAELRLALREITRAEQPTYDPQRVWAAGGAAPADAGIEGEVVWIRENSQGQELWRGVHEGEVPEVGATLGHSMVDGRPWVVREIERKNGRVGIHLSKAGKSSADPHEVGHHITVPR